MSKKVTCPNATFESIKTILLTLNFENKLSVKEMLERTNRSISWLNCATPIMGEMGLIYRGFEEIIGITNKGKELIDLIEKNNDKELKKFGEEVYKKSEILRITKNILDEKPNIKLDELGKKIVDGLEIPEYERWKNKTTYVVVARSCLSILSGLKLIDYQPVKYTRSNINRFRNKIMPYASTIIIDKKLKEFEIKNNGIYELILHKDKFNQYQRQRQTDYLNTMIMLGLIERIKGKEYRYKLTNEGEKLKNAKDFSEHAQIFQNILLKNPHIVEIIKTFKNNYDEIRSEEIGSILSEYNNTKWADNTKKAYGNNFMNWLLEADIMVKRGRKHKHTFQPHFLKSDNYKIYILSKKIETYKNDINQNISQQQVQVVSIKKPLIKDKTEIKLIFNELITKLSFIEKCSKINPFNNDKFIDDIFDNFDKLIYETDGDFNIIINHLKQEIKDSFDSLNEVELRKSINRCINTLLNLEQSIEIITNHKD